MKKLTVIVLLIAGDLFHSDTVQSGAASAGAAETAGGGEAATGGAGTGAAASGPGPAGDASASETGPGDRLGGPPAGYANDPSVYRSPVTMGPGINVTDPRQC
jgi:hypothetical protein